MLKKDISYSVALKNIGKYAIHVMPSVENEESRAIKDNIEEIIVSRVLRKVDEYRTKKETNWVGRLGEQREYYASFNA